MGDAQGIAYNILADPATAGEGEIWVARRHPLGSKEIDPRVPQRTVSVNSRDPCRAKIVMRLGAGRRSVKVTSKLVSKGQLKEQGRFLASLRSGLSE